MPLHLWHCVQPYAWSLCTCGRHSPPLPVKLAWCSSGLRLPPPSCYSDHHQTAAALRRRLLARRLRSLQSRCRRRSRLVSELDSAYQEALLLYRLLVPVVIRNLKSNMLSEPQEITVRKSPVPSSYRSSDICISCLCGSGGTTAPRRRTRNATSSGGGWAWVRLYASARDAWTRLAARLVGHVDSGRAEDSAALEQPHPRMSSEFRNSRKAGDVFGNCCLVRLSASARNSWVCE